MPSAYLRSKLKIMFDSADPPTTVFEVAPNSTDGEIFWIYEIDNPSEFFEGCESQQEASDRLIDSERSPDKQIETCGYTLVLDSPEDPPSTKSGNPPEKSIVIEVLKGGENDQQHEFYEVENPIDTFGESWGNTTSMYTALEKDSIQPILEYDNVSLIFQRSYGSL